jgi:hypothetical protein
VEVTLDLPRRPTAEELKPDLAPRMPRVTRLMALAVKYKGMVDARELRDYADIARLGYVNRARVTQIMNLANLAPEIQAHLLFPTGLLPPGATFAPTGGRGRMGSATPTLAESYIGCNVLKLRAICEMRFPQGLPGGTAGKLYRLKQEGVGLCETVWICSLNLRHSTMG